MLNSLLKIKNWCWADDRFCAELDGQDIFSIEGSIQKMSGQFAFAAVHPESGLVRLMRDRLGINKLFFVINNSKEVTVANYLVDLVASGAPMRAIFSVPAGHILDIDLETKRLTLKRYFNVRLAGLDNGGALEASAAKIRRDIETWFERLAKHWQSRRICVCVSGGLDSGIIAALAARYFSRVVFYTYGFVDGKEHRSTDTEYARQLAAFLGCPLHHVPADAEDVLNTVDRALMYGQDWRDFNVHCAIVNDLLASAIRRGWIESGDELPPVVLTGDLMNEFLADYTAIHYQGHEYYRLPRLNPDSLRLVLIKGLDAGDREVGVFGHYGIDLAQPYGLLADRLMALPGPLVIGSNAKQRLMKAVAEDLLPSWIFERPKVRAQIGSADEPIGILPVLHDAGYDQKWLQDRFCQLLGIENASFLNLFIRSGQYRYAAHFPIEVYG